MAKDRKGHMGVRRLTWEESQPHYKALKEIEDQNTPKENSDKPLSNGQRKRFEADKHNETRIYLNEHGLTYTLGGFYVEEE